MNIVYDFLRSDGSVVVNKRLIHAIGLHEAILYSELLSKRNYFESRGMLEHGYFYNTADNLFRDTGLSAKQQRSAIKKLEDYGLIKTHLHGVPAKKYFKIVDNIQILQDLMLGNVDTTQLGTLGTTRKALSAQLDGQKGYGNNTKNNTNNNTRVYITLTSDDSFLSFYLSSFIDVYGKQHMRVKESDIEVIEQGLNEIQESLSYEEYCDMVTTYFEQLPPSNNGNILSFIKAKDRYLLSWEW